MTWLLPGLALVFTLVLATSLLLVRPSRGEAADRVARPVQERMEEHPVRWFWLPLVAFVASALHALSSIAAESQREARATRAVLAVIPVIACVLLVRFRRWPK